MAYVADIRRYPVKGLGGESMPSATLTAGGGLPGDRRLAIAGASTDLDPAHAEWRPRENFVTRVRAARLGQLGASLDDERDRLTIHHRGEPVAEGCITTPDGREAIESFLAWFLREDVRETPVLVDARDGHLTDADEPLVSLLNLSSVEDLAAAAGTAIDPRRFRANVHIAGLDPWVERHWIGATIGIGGVTVDGDEETERCAVTTVNPDTGERDLQTLKLLRRHHGHLNMGVYTVVTGGGRIDRGDAVTPPRVPA